MPPEIFPSVVDGFRHCSGHGLPQIRFRPPAGAGQFLRADARHHRPCALAGEKRRRTPYGLILFDADWQLQVSDDLLTRTLSQLASAPSRWLAIPSQRANLANGLLDASLKDVVLDECYLEVRQPASQPAELAFAIHLDPEGVGNWETNLANIVGLLAGEWPAPATNGLHGWSLHRTQPPSLLQFQRVNDWAVFGAGTESNTLFNGICDRVRRYNDPFAANASTNWLEADVDLARLAVLDPQFLSRVTRHSSLPRLHLIVTGDGANVLTQGKLIFPGPLHLDCAPWTPPANLIP